MGGSATVKDIVVGNDLVDFTSTVLETVQEQGCAYMDFYRLGVGGTNLKAAFENDNFSYPFKLKFDLKSPSGTNYAVERTFNNKNDVVIFLAPYQYGDQLHVKDNLIDARIPKEEGEWEVTATVTTCGVDKVLPSVKKTYINPLKNIKIQESTSSTSNACHTTNITISNKELATMTIKLYVVLLQAPTDFDYAGAGFYKINTTDPNLQNKYLKEINYYTRNNSALEIVAPDYIKRQNDVFQFRLVDAQCSLGRSEDLPSFPITRSLTPEDTVFRINRVEGCRGVTATGTSYGSFFIYKQRGSDIREVKITAFDGNPADLPFVMPYTVPASNNIGDNEWAIYDLPVGNYTIEVTNACGKTTVTPNQRIIGETFALNWATGCTPSLTAQITSGRAYFEHVVTYRVQHFDKNTNTWTNVGEALPFDSQVVRQFTNDALKEGKFRILRSIQVSRYGASCEQVISEKEYIGDLKTPTVVGFGCDSNTKFHVAIVPEGGTPPYTYELVSKRAPGSTTPTNINQTQPGDNFFIDLAETNLNTVYTFAVTDHCLNRKTVETTFLNIQPPKIVADKEFYCVGQQATLSLPDMGSSIVAKWYREDAPTNILGTGNTLTVTLTAADFIATNKYKVTLEVTSQSVVQQCIKDQVNAYEFKSQNYSQPTLPTPKSTTICVDNNATQDLKELFQNIPANLGGGTATIRDKAGVIFVPDNGVISLRNMKGEYTFVYTLWNPCEESVATVEAKLTVNRKINPTTKTDLKVCNTTVTIDELKSLILADSPQVVAIAPEFHWYQSLTAAQQNNSPLAGNYQITTTTPTTLYLRYSKNGYCSDQIHTITIEGQTTVVPKTLGTLDCSVATIKDLKALVDPADKENVRIYKNGDLLGDDALVEDSVGYTYTKNLYQCVPTAVALTFTVKQRPAAAPQTLDMCTFFGYNNQLSTTYGDVLAKLQALYPGTTIRVYDDTYLYTNTSTNMVITNTRLSFTVEESDPNKCPSFRAKLTLRQAPFSNAVPLSLTICQDTTVAELIAQIEGQGYTNVKIYGATMTEQPANHFIVFGNPYYYRTEETGKCPSPFMPLTFTRNTNITSATPRRFEVCLAQSATARISDLKATIGGGEVKIFKRNNDNTWSAPLQDNETVDENQAYFYTLRETGKCPSEKTPLIVAITRKTATPTAPPSGDFCQGATVANLKDFIDNTPQNAGKKLRVYANNTDTTELTDATLLTQITYYFSLHEDTDPTKCESDRKDISVTLTVAPTPQATYTYCTGTKVATLLDAIDSAKSQDLRLYENASGGTPLNRTADLQARTYYVALSNSNASLGTCETTRAQFNVALNPVTAITGDLSTAEVTYCKDATTVTPLTVTTTGTGTLTYKWFKAPDDTSAGTQITTATTNSYTPEVDTVGTAYYYVEVHSDCGADVTSVRAHITVTKPTAITTDLSTVAVTYCKNETSVTPLSVTAEGTAPFTYTWHKVEGATDTVVATQANVTQTQDTYTPAVTAVGTTYYYVVVHSACGTDITSTRAQIVVTETTDIDSDLNSIEVFYCKDATGVTPLSITAKGTAPFTYIWYKSGTPSTVGAQQVAQHTTNVAADSYTPDVDTAGTAYYYVVVHSACGTDVSSAFAHITVRPLTATPTLSTANLCTDSTVGNLRSFIATTVLGTIKIYATTTGGTDLSDATALTATAYYYTAQQTGECESDRRQIDVTLVQAPTVDANYSFCAGATVDDLWKAIDATDTDDSIRICYNTPTGGTPLVRTAPLVAGTYYIAETVSNGGVFTCETPRRSTVVTIGAVANPTISEKAAASCTAVSVAQVDNYAPTLTYTITNSTNATVAGASVAADGTINGLTTAGSYKIKAVQGTCDSAETTFTIRGVMPTPATPTVTVTSASCASVSVATITNYDNTLSYYEGTRLLTVNAMGEITTALGAGSYTLTARNNGGCSSMSSGSFTIDPQLTATTTTDPLDATYAKDVPAAPLTVTATGEGILSYKWFENTTRSTTGATEVATTSSYTPSTATVGTKYYYVEVTASCGVARSNIASITVTAPHRNRIEAVADSFKVSNRATTTTSETVFSQGVDRLEGKSGILSPTTDVILRSGTSPHSGISMSGTGNITVESGTPAGVYEFPYTICERGAEDNCSSTTVTIEVVNGRIVANDDGVWYMGVKGGETPSILDNDSIDGRVGISGTEVTIERTAGTPTPEEFRFLEVNRDGRITVREGMPEGTYTYYYTIISREDTSERASAKVTIVISKFVAQEDVFELENPRTRELTTPSVLENDEYNGNKNPKDDVDVTPGEPSHPNLRMNPDGTITIASGTPDGTYTYTYKICRRGQPNDCSNTATAIIKLYPVIRAEDDDYSSTVISTEEERTFPSVLGNDTVAGNAITDTSEVRISVVNNGGLNGVRINEAGEVKVPQGTPSGTYKVTYSLCLSAHPSRCDEAMITIVVSNNRVLKVYNGVTPNGDGENDRFVIEGIELYPNNTVRIFNRWGVEVYHKQGYRNVDGFAGYSNGRVTISEDTKLPQGTYYYILEYEDEQKQHHQQSGWLYLKRD